MAYAIPTGGIIQTVWVGSYQNNITNTVLHWRLSTSPITDGGAALAIIAAWMQGATVGTAYRATIGPEWIGRRTQAQLITPQRYRPVQQTWSDQGTGGSAPTLNVAAALTRYGEAATRHAVGTIHMPAVPSENQVGGRLTAGAVSAYNSVLGFWVGSQALGTSSQWTPILFDRVNPGSSIAVVGSIVQPTVRTERRRTLGVGI